MAKGAKAETSHKGNTMAKIQSMAPNKGPLAHSLK
jgi:hypothetical protein